MRFSKSNFDYTCIAEHAEEQIESWFPGFVSSTKIAE
jgi:hypothetical protein